jgi:hypothetical protein
VNHSHDPVDAGAQEQQPLLTLTSAGRLKWLPCRRNGKRPNVATLWRWARYGCFGIRLKTTSVGGTLCTTEGDLRAFFDEIARRREVAP